MPPPLPPAPGVHRVIALDWLRTLTIGYVLLYHVAQVYAGGSWTSSLRDDAAHWLVGPVVMALGLWRMPLMFLIAGASMAHVLRRRPVRAFLRLRAQRLVLPFGVTLAFVVPLLRYADAYASEAPLAFATHAWTALLDGGVPQWYHLWFIPQLTAVTLASLGARACLRRLAPGRGGTPTWEAARRLTGAHGLPALGALSVGVQLLPVRALAPLQVVPGLDARQFGAAAVLFAAGVLVARHDATLQRVVRGRRMAAALAVALAALTGALVVAHALGVALLPPVAAGGRLVSPDECAVRVAGALGAWYGAAAVLGYGCRYLTRSGPVLEYLRDASYVVYLLHQAVLAWLVRGLAGWHGSPAVEYVTLVALTTAGTLACYEYAIRRTPAGRVLFGLPARVETQRPPELSLRVGQGAAGRVTAAP